MTLSEPQGALDEAPPTSIAQRGIRPFEPEWFGGAAEHHFRKIRPGVDTLPWGTLRERDFDPELLRRAQRSWTEAAYNEYCSAIAFSQLVRALLDINAPVDLVGMASDFLVDETLHVELTSRLSMELGGGARYEVDYEKLAIPIDPRLSPFEVANDLMVRLCCVGEAFSLPMLAGTLRATTHPLVHGVLEQIVRDESHHGRLGYLYLEWADAELTDRERTRLAGTALSAVKAMAPLWQKLRSRVVGEVTTEGFKVSEIHDLGWMLSEDYGVLARRSVEEHVVAPLAQFGIHLDPDGVAALLR